MSVATRKRSHDVIDEAVELPNNRAFRSMAMDPSTEFVPWLQAVAKNNIPLDHVVTGENPELTGLELYNANEAIFFSSMRDAAIKYPKYLPTRIIQFLVEQPTWFARKLPIRITDKTNIKWSQTKIERHRLEPATMKTAPRIISTSVSSREKTTVYRSLGATMDKYALEKPGAVQEWNLKMNQLYAGLQASMYLEAMRTFRDDVSFFALPERKYPFAKMPTTVAEVFDYERQMWGALNRRELGIEYICGLYNEIFAREEHKLEGVFLTRDDYDYIKTRDAARLYTFVSGSAVNRNRLATGSGYAQEGGAGREPVSIEFYEIPLLDESIHNNTDEAILRANVATGSLAIFLNDTYDMAPEKYFSGFSDIYMASWTSNGYDRYRLRDVWHKCFQFQAVDECPTYYYQNHGDKHTPLGERSPTSRQEYYNNAAALPGHVNRALLRRFIAKRERLFSDARTDIVGNEDMLDPFVRYDPSILEHPETARTVDGPDSRDATGPFVPIMFVGEIEERVNPTRLMRQVYQTAAVQLFKGVSATELATFERGVKWAEARKLTIVTIFAENTNIARGVTGPTTLSDAEIGLIPAFVAVYKRVVMNALNCFHGNICLDPRLVPAAVKGAVTDEFTASCIVFWYTAVSRFSTKGRVRITEPTDTGTNVEIKADGKDAAKVREDVLKELFERFRFEASADGAGAELPSNSPMFGDTLFGALPFVNNVLPLLPRTSSQALKDSGILPDWMLPTETTNLNPFLGNGTYQDYMSVMLYNEAAYEAFRAKYCSPNSDTKYPDALAHLIFFPVTGNPLSPNPRVSTFEARWIEASTYETRENIAAHLVLTTVVSVQTLCEFYDHNIAPYLRAAILRPFEEQDMHALVFSAEGRLGTTYVSNASTITSFEADSKTFYFEADMAHATALDYTDKFIVAENMRGGMARGGKGNGWIRDIVSVPSIVDHEGDARLEAMRTKLGKGSELGNYSNIAVVQGLAATEGQAAGPRELSLTGCYDKRLFAGRLNDCAEFHQMQKAPQYEGVFFNNFIHQFRKLIQDLPELPAEKLNYESLSDMRRTNVHCHMTSQLMTDRTGNLTKLKSYHMWGEQGRDIARIETSQGRVGYISK
jgi:hypothetical protein